ncbi:MAG: rhodanese-like domain-containing protein [Polyangiaceae bacterium]
MFKSVAFSACFSMLGLLASVRSAEARTPRDELVVSTAWLAAHLEDPDLVLLHVGDKADYAAKHLPRARHVMLSDISVSGEHGKGLMLEMPSPEDLRHRLEALGISDSSRIVVYFGKDWVSPATRVVFTLDYAGLGDHTSFLDGGIGAWIRAGKPTTDVVPPARGGSLAPLKVRPIVVTADDVRASLGRADRAVIDGRAASFYDGVDTGGMKGFPHRTGHVAGARNVPFTSITDDEGMLRSNAELAALFAEAGVKDDDTIIGYCHIGQQATAMLFAARLLGHPVWLYDGSFEDWSRRKELPVEKSPRARGKK